MPAAKEPCIRIIAAPIINDSGQVLLVRKRGTCVFMQPGGKPEAVESDLAALDRELQEELGCRMEPATAALLGRFRAPAANEKGYFVDATLYQVTLIGRIAVSAEIEEIIWLDPFPPHAVELAPLTRMNVLPLAMAERR